MLRIYRVETASNYYYAVADAVNGYIHLNNIRPYVAFRGTRLMRATYDVLSDTDESVLQNFQTCQEFSIHKFDGFISMEGLFNLTDEDGVITIKDVTNGYYDPRLLNFIKVASILNTEDGISSMKKEEELKTFYNQFLNNYYEHNK